MLDRIGQTIELVGVFPRLGHKGIASGALEAVVPGTPYVVIYSPPSEADEASTTLRIYHAAQDRS